MLDPETHVILQAGEFLTGHICVFKSTMRVDNICTPLDCIAQAGSDIHGDWNWTTSETVPPNLSSGICIYIRIPLLNWNSAILSIKTAQQELQGRKLDLFFSHILHIDINSGLGRANISLTFALRYFRARNIKNKTPVQVEISHSNLYAVKKNRLVMTHILNNLLGKRVIDLIQVNTER